MTTQQEAEAAIVFRARDEASEDIESIAEETREADESFTRMGRSAVGAGIALLGLGFGVREVGGAISEAADVNAELRGTIALLAPELQGIIDEAQPFFDDFAREWALTESDVERAAATIIRNAGDAIKSQEDLENAMLAMAVAAAISGADIETAAAAIGQAMQGNLEPINALLDGTGRKIVEFSDLVDENLVEVARDSVTEWDRFLGIMKRVPEELGRNLGPIFENPLDWRRWANAIGFEEEFDAIGDFIVNTIPEWATDAFNAAVDAGEGLAEFFVDAIFDPIKRFFTEILPGWISDNFNILELLPDLSLPDVTEPFGSLPDFTAPFDAFGDLFSSNAVPGSGGGNVQVVINGNVDSPERAAEFARQVARQLQQNNRRGPNVAAV